VQLGLHHLLALQHLRVQLELQQVLEQVVLLHLRAQVLQLRQEQVAPLHLRAQVLQLQQVLRALVRYKISGI